MPGRVEVGAMCYKTGRGDVGWTVRSLGGVTWVVDVVCEGNSPRVPIKPSGVQNLHDTTRNLQHTSVARKKGPCTRVGLNVFLNPMKLDMSLLEADETPSMPPLMEGYTMGVKIGTGAFRRPTDTSRP